MRKKPFDQSQGRLNVPLSAHLKFTFQEELTKSELLITLNNLELKWVNLLFEGCVLQFKNTFLPSHDQWHHLRVWKYACRLLKAAHLQKISIRKRDAEDLLIACFFHDQGMSITPSAEHGKISLDICLDFFIQLKVPSFIPDQTILNAIYHHDNKDYLSCDVIKEFDLQTFLNLADDLDAFGIIGIYRYTEIYLARGMDLAILPDNVMKNLRIRFQHLIDSFSFAKEFILEQTDRYSKTLSFFKELEVQLSDRNSNTNLKGPLLVVTLIRDLILRDHILPQEILTNHSRLDMDEYSKQFFSLLRQEYITSTNIEIQ